MLVLALIGRQLSKVPDPIRQDTSMLLQLRKMVVKTQR